MRHTVTGRAAVVVGLHVPVPVCVCEGVIMTVSIVLGCCGPSLFLLHPCNGMHLHLLKI